MLTSLIAIAGAILLTALSGNSVVACCPLRNSVNMPIRTHVIVPEIDMHALLTTI